jgi:isocitrate/isopropylmalate dehydrogenase
MGAILAAGMMLEYLGWAAEAKSIENAVRVALREGKTPAELGGTLGTRDLGDFIADTVVRAGF